MRVFGPVLLYDMIRMARRSRFVLLRVLYALVLFSTLFLVYASFFPFTSWNTWLQTTGEPGTLSAFASAFFAYFMIIQWVTILLLTPAYVAGAIAEEKHRKTLEYILATDLRNHEVILGKLVSRLGNLTLFILAGLPILSLTQLFGGVAPDLLWSGFAVTALTMLSLSGLSMFISVYARRPRDAILLTYLSVISYFACYGVLLALRLAVFNKPSPGSWPTDFESGAQFAFDWLWYGYNSGNVFQGLYDLFSAIGFTTASGGYGAVLWDLLVRYAAFHGTILVGCTALAVLRVRRVFVKQTYSTARSAPASGKKRASRHATVGNYPMLWKEIVSEGGFGIGWVGAAMTLFIGLIVVGFGVAIILWVSLHAIRAEENLLLVLTVLVGALGLILALFVVSFWLPRTARISVRVLAVVIGAAVLFLTAELCPGNLGPSGRNDLSSDMNIYVRFAGTIVAALSWLAITVRAAGAVGSERDRQTLDSLLASPLSNIEILLAKWLGSLVAVRWLFAVLGLVWLMGLLSGGLSVAGLVLASGALIIYSAFFCSLGLFCSVHCRTTLRAVLWAVGASIFLGGAHLFCTMSCMMVFLFRAGPGSEWPLMFLLGQTPVFVMGAAALRGDEFSSYQAREMNVFAVFAFVGACTFVLAAIFLWAATVERFKYSCGRVTGQRHAPPVDSRPPADKPKITAAPGDAAGP